MTTRALLVWPTRATFIAPCRPTPDGPVELGYDNFVGDVLHPTAIEAADAVYVRARGGSWHRRRL